MLKIHPHQAQRIHHYLTGILSPHEYLNKCGLKSIFISYVQRLGIASLERSKGVGVKYTHFCCKESARFYAML